MIDIALWAAWLAGLAGGIFLEKRWRRSGAVFHLYACYAAMYGGLGALLLSMWLGGDRWWAVAGVVLVVIMLPWVVRVHRREIRTYGRPR
jgi:FtsH-binding integral membrane protein